MLKGYKYEILPSDIAIRQWVCKNCKIKHDRDKNASKNILTEGLRILEQGTAA